MEGLQTSTPRRLSFIRIIVTLGLILSFLMSMNLWCGERVFPSNPVITNFTLGAPLDYILVILSICCLICSLFLRKHRLFIFLSLAINIFLVLLDLNRLQAWFYVYNAILFVLMFYNGRVDDSGRYTYFFIIIQLIIASVYIYNGISQFNSYFLQSDFYDVISPLENISSQRQFEFFMSAGKFVPYFVIFIGLGLIIKPARYLAISAAWFFHLVLLILLFPSAKNTNYALWFMNLIFGILVLFLFSGKTQTRYFNWLLLFQKPLFYVVMFAFWVVPIFNLANHWPYSPTTNFKYGNVQNRFVAIDENTFRKLPPYLKHFCSKNNNNYFLKVSEWCRHELKSEYNSPSPLQGVLIDDIIQITSTDVKETEDELSAL